jgi:hypothetical protein
VSQFLQNAARILDAAECASSGNGSKGLHYPDMTILIGPEGGIQMVTESGELPLEVLQTHHGAQMAYRVTQQETKVRLEGRAGGRTCLFEAERPEVVARTLLGSGGAPRYLLID